MATNQSIGQVVREARLLRGLRQNQISDVPQSTIASIELGRRHPTPDTWRKIARTLNLPPLEECVDTPRIPSSIGRQLARHRQAQDWLAVWEVGNRFLKRYQNRIPPALYQEVHQHLREATRHMSMPEFLLSVARKDPDPEIALQIGARLYASGADPRTLIKHYAYMRQTVNPAHQITGKILNNGMVFWGLTGDLPATLAWNEAAITWEQTHHEILLSPELWASRFRYLAHFGVSTALGEAQEAVKAAHVLHTNAYVWEDYFYGMAWHAFWSDQADLWAQIKREAKQTRDAKWQSMPPFLALWEAAWTARAGDPHPMSRWVSRWTGEGWDAWSDRSIWYLNDAVLTMVVTNHPELPAWALWVTGYCRNHGLEGWLALWNALASLKHDAQTCIAHGGRSDTPPWVWNMAQRMLEHRDSIADWNPVLQAIDVEKHKWAP